MWELLTADPVPLGGRFTAPDQGLRTRRVDFASPGLGKFNVVLVAEESFGCEHVDACGAGRGLTPEFDALAGQGLFFTNAYATGTRTVRGLEAITASIPPIPSESILKRPGYEKVANWGEIMADLGYRTSFLYGGIGQFDNMNNFFAAHGYQVSYRSDIPDPRFGNIWGVSDQDLFDHALDYFDAEHASGQPFFSLIMSTSNHKPYTFPEGGPAEGGGRKAGVRYSDYALGEFFRKARGACLVRQHPLRGGRGSWCAGPTARHAYPCTVITSRYCSWPRAIWNRASSTRPPARRTSRPP